MTPSKLEQWFPVSVTGEYPQGDLTDSIFDEVVETFDPAIHEPPVTLGHITKDHNDKPSMAWVAGIKRVGNMLYTKGRQVWKDFDQMVKDGRYKKRSIGIRQNSDGKWYMHHLAFLGATPPAAKGLPDIYEGIPDEYAAANYDNSDLESQIDNFPYEGEISPKSKDGKMDKKYTENDLQVKLEDQKKVADKQYQDGLEAEKKKVAEDTRKEVEKEYNDKVEEGKRFAAHNTEMDKFVDQGIKDGIINPAMVKAGLKDLLYSMNTPVELNFKEGDKEVKSNTLKVFLEVLKAYKTVSTEGKEDPEKNDGKGNYEDQKKRAFALVKSEKEAGREITFGDALKTITVEDVNKKKK